MKRKLATSLLLSIAIAFLGTYASAEINDNLVAYYPFDTNALRGQK
ncbi:MAG: hypothetical protein ACYSSP_03505 [Planctomycetota bacterium]|jgi:hypothetical protein